MCPGRRGKPIHKQRKVSFQSVLHNEDEGNNYFSVQLFLKDQLSQEFDSFTKQILNHMIILLELLWIESDSEDCYLDRCRLHLFRKGS